jgi:hypothetical protein
MPNLQDSLVLESFHTMMPSTYEQKEQMTSESLIHQRCTVSFSDDVITHEIPRLDADETADVYYSRSDYKQFQIAQQIRVDRHRLVKQVERMIEDASAILEAHTLELDRMQTPAVDDLLLVHPATMMPVRRRASSPSRMEDSDVSNFEAADSDSPSMPLQRRNSEPPRKPVRRVSKSRITVTPDLFSSAPAVALSEPPGMPVRRVSKSRITVTPDLFHRDSLSSLYLLGC